MRIVICIHSSCVNHKTKPESFLHQKTFRSKQFERLHNMPIAILTILAKQFGIFSFISCPLKMSVLLYISSFEMGIKTFRRENRVLIFSNYSKIMNKKVSTEVTPLCNFEPLLCQKQVESYKRNVL